MTRRGPLVAAGASVLVVVLGVVFLLLPAVGRVRETRERLEAARAAEQTLRNRLAALEAARDRAEDTRSELAALEPQVPPTADLPGVIRLLAGAADAAAVDFFSVAPGAPSAQEGTAFSRVPAQIQVTGSYFALEEFLYRLEALPRAVKVLSLTITPEAEAGGTLTMQLNAEFYTSDVSAGPGSVPGPTRGTPAPPTPGAAPTTGEA